MKIMVLAAGRGARLRPLTDRIPKPLVELGGRGLVEHHLYGLAQAGFTDVVMNVAYRGAQIIQALGDGSRYGLNIRYSQEVPGELDTGGGIVKALPLLGDAPFAVVNADIFTDFPWQNLAGMTPAGDDNMHLLLVPNPPHRPGGDFQLHAGRVCRPEPAYTFAGIGVYHPRVFADLAPGRRSLADLLFTQADAGRVAGSLYTGRWFDVGTPQALTILRERFG